MLEGKSDDEEEDLKIWELKMCTSSQCLQFICSKYHISHYAYDTTHKFFLKHVESEYNHYSPLSYAFLY